MPSCLPAVVDDDTRVLVLGSMPGEMSLARQQYYAHPRNAFWRIMSDLFGIDANAGYSQRLGGLRAAGIGLWDVLRTCERQGSLDSAIEREGMQPNDFPALFAGHPDISRVYFNGAKAEHLFSRLVAPRLRAPVAWSRLPSTSPANAAISYDAKLAAWRAVTEVG